MPTPDKSTGCDGKIKYASRSAANREIQRIERHRSKYIRRGRSRLIVYACAFCPYFHVGHTLAGKRVVRRSVDEEEDIYESIS